MDTSNLHKRLILVEYPAVVRNPERAQQTLGGINRISDVFCTEKRLPLTFHPDNVYAKPTQGDRTEGSGLLLRIVIRRPKNAAASGDSKPSVQTKSVSIVGLVDTTYQFKGERTQFGVQLNSIWLGTARNRFGANALACSPQKCELFHVWHRYAVDGRTFRLRDKLDQLGILLIDVDDLQDCRTSAF